MTDPEVKRIVTGDRDGLPEILQALRSTEGDRATIVIPPESGLFLTASEFRTLKTTAEQVGVTVTVETDDRLRRQLAQMFTVEWQPLPARPPVERTPSAWPARPSSLADDPAVGASDLPAAVDSDGHPDDPSGAAAADTAPEDPAEDPLELKTSKPWRAEVIDASRETALPPPPSMTPETVDDLEELPRVDGARRRRPGAAGRRRIALAGAVVAAVLVLGLLGSVWLRSATVRVTLKRQPVTSEVLFGVRSEGVEQIDGAAFMVDGRPVNFETTYTTTVPVTGSVTKQTAAATGTLQLRNIGDAAVTIPTGTELTTREGIRYRTTADASLKAGSTAKPAEGSVEVESVTGGDAANHETGTLVGALDGFDGVYYANLDGPVTGGEGRKAKGVSAEDKDKIVTLAQAELDKLAAGTTAPGGGRVVPSTLAPRGGLSYTLDHQVGDVTETLTIEAKLTYDALAIDPSAVGSQADAALRSGLVNNVPAGYELDPSTVQLGTADAAPDATGGLMRISATAQARTTLDDAERDQLKDAMAGKSTDDARAAAAANPDVAAVSINVTPGWLVRSLPSAGRIKVTTT